MLRDHPVDVVLEVPDLAEARDFYVRRLGLDVVREDDRGALELKTGNDSRIALNETSNRSAEEQTRASWRVSDLEAELAELRARGVEFKEYDLPTLKTKDGVADLGFAWAAWFVDPGRNVVGILQYK